MWGETCFECGVKPNEQGTGRRFTKAARKAQDAVSAFVKEQFSRRADEVRPGMLFLPYGRTPALQVQEVRNPGSSGRVNPDGSTSWGIDLCVARTAYCYQPDYFVSVVPSQEEWNAMVLPFVRTLQGVTVEGDVAVGVYRLVKGKGGNRVDYVARWGSLAGALVFISEQGPRARRRMFVAPIEHDRGRVKSWAA
jgi:hypothetical protein